MNYTNIHGVCIRQSIYIREYGIFSDKNSQSSVLNYIKIILEICIKILITNKCSLLGSVREEFTKALFGYFDNLTIYDEDSQTKI